MPDPSTMMTIADEAHGPFSAHDREAIHAYEHAVSGTWDAIVTLLLNLGEGTTADHPDHEIPVLFRLFHDWHTHLDTLISAVRDPGSPRPRREPVDYYLRTECDDLAHRLNMARAMACEHAFGTAGPHTVESGAMELSGEFVQLSGYAAGGQGPR